MSAGWSLIRLRSLRKRPFLMLGAVSFVYAGTVALLIQSVLLPYVFPHLHAGQGLLVGGDWLAFHRVAVDLAQQIAQQGWQVWQLRPAGHAPAGVAAIFYTLFTPEPWVLIPINAALHALATVLLARIVWMVTGNARISILAALPFLFFPSASAWYAQIHKDGFFIAGFYACMHGWLLLLQVESWRARYRTAVLSVFWIVVGTLLVGLVRDYAVQLVSVIGVLFSLFVALRILRTHKMLWPTSQRVLAVILVFAIPLVTIWLSSNHYKDGSVIISQNPGAPEHNSLNIAVSPLVETWRWTPVLPRPIDENFYALSALRHGHVINYPDAKSTVDLDIRFNSALEFLPYLPRALQLGFLAPFPHDWVAEGNIDAGTKMRRVGAIEMLCVYVAGLFLPYALWRWRERMEVWLVVAGCTIAITLYAYVIPNIGTLYRMRFGFLMVMVALGVAGALSLANAARYHSKESTLSSL